MTTINTTDDLLSLLRENQEFREAVRQAILSEELLALPATFNAFVSEMREFVSEMRSYTKATDKRLENLEEGQQRLEQGQQDIKSEMRSYTKTTDKRLGNLEEGQQRLEQGQQELKVSVDSLRGNALEAKLSTKLIPLVSREFDIRRVYPIWTPGIIAVQGSTEEFQDRMEQATEDGTISDADETRLRVTDLILRSQRKADRSTLWFAVEASGVVNDDDIDRAHRSANAVRKIYGQDAIPLVYGYRIHEEQMKLAGELEVLVFLDPDRD